MLFTDSNLISASDMAAMDSEVLGISNDPKSGITTDISINEAWRLCRSKLEAALQLFTTLHGVSGQEAHLSAVFNTGWSQPGTRARIRLNQIVAHDPFYSNSRSQIQGWVLCESLAHFFRSIATRYVPIAGTAPALVDRYMAKVMRYEELANTYWRNIRNSGIPFVQSVFECPGAKHGLNPGSWGSGNLSTISGGTSTQDLAVNVAITYTDSSAYVDPDNKNNGESGPSEILAYTIPLGTLLSIDITSLRPPNSARPDQVGFSQGTLPIHTATHWNIYVGPSGSGVGTNSPLCLQESLIPIATKQYSLGAAPLFSPVLPVLQFGQYPDPGSNILFGNTVKRS